MNGFVMKAHNLIRLQRNHRVCAALIVAEFNFVHSRSPDFYNGPDLTADQTVFGEVFQKGNHGM